jgi:hypothetical protein
MHKDGRMRKGWEKKKDGRKKKGETKESEKRNYWFLI